MCAKREAVRQRHAAAVALGNACLPFIVNPMTAILDRGLNLDPNNPADMEGMLDRIGKRNGARL